MACDQAAAVFSPHLVETFRPSLIGCAYRTYIGLTLHTILAKLKISVDLSIKLEPVFIKSSTFRHLLGRSIWLWERKNTRYVMIDLLKFCLWAITFG